MLTYSYFIDLRKISKNQSYDYPKNNLQKKSKTL